MECLVLSEEVVSALTSQGLLQSIDDHKYHLSMSVLHPGEQGITVIPRDAHSVYGLIYVGFNQRTAQKLWRRYWCATGSSLGDVVYQHIVNPAIEDIWYYNEDWTRVMAALGFSEEVQRKFRHPPQPQPGCKYQLLKHVSFSYTTLVGLDGRLRKRLGLPERNSTQIKLTHRPGGTRRRSFAEPTQVARAREEYPTVTLGNSLTATSGACRRIPPTLYLAFKYPTVFTLPVPKPKPEAVPLGGVDSDDWYRQIGQAITLCLRGYQYYLQENLVFGKELHSLGSPPRLAGVNLPATYANVHYHSTTLPPIISSPKIEYGYEY